jgi:anti-sigma factor RsiW
MEPPRNTDIGEEQISAWVDGEGSPEQRAAVEAWLHTHPEDAARAAAWAADRAALRAEFTAVASEPVPPRLSAVVWRRHSLAPVWTLAAGAAAVFALGGLGGALVARQWPAAAPRVAQSEDRWVQRAAFAHSVYTPEPRHAVEVKAQEEHLARWLTRRIAAPVKLFNLRDQGFELMGGRLLPDGTGKSAQLMYEDAVKRRVTVYLRKPERGTETAFRYEQHGPIGIFYWVEEDCGYALAGELPRHELLALAKAIHDQESAAPAGASSPSR